MAAYRSGHISHQRLAQDGEIIRKANAGKHGKLHDFSSSSTDFPPLSGGGSESVSPPVGGNGNGLKVVS
eukprot:5558271-Karenia_brevis.AAC.1